MVNHRKLFGTQILDTLRGQFQSSHLDVTVQVLGTGLTGNSQLSHWLAQFSLVLIGREGSCDVETAAVKRAVRTWWRPGKGCGRVGRVDFFGEGLVAADWNRPRWNRACLLALQVTMKCKNGRGWGGCVALTTIEILGPFLLQWKERSMAHLLDPTTLVSTNHKDIHGPPFLFLTSVRCSQPSI